MKPPRHRKTVYQKRFNDGLGRKFRIHVTVNVTDYWIDGKWEETINGEEFRKVEAAIEKKYPGWFHTCYLDRNGKRQVSKEDCKACQRKRLTKQKSLVN